MILILTPSPLDKPRPLSAKNKCSKLPPGPKLWETWVHRAFLSKNHAKMVTQSSSKNNKLQVTNNK